jgi:aspartyl-tRNA(Asn)/glutamyl-tRNA(Gln) amidotransferase subunit B
MKYYPTIGLEIHVELKTRSKMFCSCPNDPDEKIPNTLVCPVCMGHPGTLPVINKEAVRKTVKAGLALNCRIPEHSKFDRKNYFYPDLPKGYQISQYDMPLCLGGFLEINGRKIRIRRIHLEEDTGRLIHSREENASFIDFNRAGVPLMELVTEPDIESAFEAKAFARELQLILRYLGVSSADMEKGQMRVEANVSVSLDPGEKKGTKVEVKNINSFRAVEKAIDYEIARQTELLEKGKKVVQETRGWREQDQKTISQRTKEEAHDYRYFPEPDLPPLRLEKDFIFEIQQEVPELPSKKRKRFEEEYGLNQKEIETFVSDKDLSEFYEKVMSEFRNWVKESEEKKRVEEKEFLKLSKIASNYILSDLLGLLKGISVEGENFLITPENFAELVNLIYHKKMSSRIAKDVLKEMLAKGADPSQIMEKKGMTQMEDSRNLETVVKDTVSDNPKVVEDFKKGKKNARQFLIGQVMARTKGRADPEAVKKILKNILPE